MYQVHNERGSILTINIIIIIYVHIIICISYSSIMYVDVYAHTCTYIAMMSHAHANS